MSHTLNLLQELLLTLFLALGCAWFAIDLARKLRAPQSSPEPHRDAAPAAAPALTAPVAAPSTAAPSSVGIPAPVSLVAVAPAATPAPAAAAVEPLVAGVPASHLAAITAAVHHLFKGRVRLASVLPAGGSSSASNSAIDWAREGRRDIFTSHRVR
jgi:hypothetical protein